MIRKRSLALIGVLVMPVIVHSRQRLFTQHPVRSNYEQSSEGNTVFSRRTLKVWEHRFLHADASTEDPDDVFRELRVKIMPSSGRRQRGGKRKLQDDSDGGNFVNADAPSEEGTGADDSPVTNSSDFNVTAETEYNVTTISSGSNHTNDTTTIVHTQNNATNTNSTSFKFRPLRIRAFLSELDGGGKYLTEEEHDMLLQDIVRPALLSWSAALRVQPVKGNLSIDASQLVDGVSCGPGIKSGLPTAPVPDEHIALGVPDTDLIVYLDLGFDIHHGRSNSTWTNTSQSQLFNNSDESNSTEGHGTRRRTQLAPELGISDIFQREEPVCRGDYLAASSFCAMDSQDRPTASLLHICIGRDFFSPDKLQTNIMTIMHELGHSLGFNSFSMAHFRKADGSPWTPRDAHGQVPTKLVECTGPQGSRVFSNVTLPSNDILKFRTVRGGVRVAEIVTPSVRQVVRNHFDCQELPGAELESGDFLPLSAVQNHISCIGDHFERRLFKSDLMNPIVDSLEFNPRFSTVSLAFFADSGWYQVDLSRSSMAASWGRGAGCAFVEETCINDGEVPPSYDFFFCNQAPRVDLGGFETDIHGCTPDLSRKAACSIGRYVGELPREYQYFNHTLGADVGGSDPFMDYCPVYDGFANGLCSDGVNAAQIRVNRMEVFGQRNSRCLSARVLNKKQNPGRTALCLPIACVVQDRSLRVQVNGAYLKCRYKGQTLKALNGDEVICPDPIRVCPTFYCQRDCLGTNRICNYTLGECVCQNGTHILDVPASQNCPDIPVESNETKPQEPPQPQRPAFYNPPTKESDLPDEDSPLADYYVPTERELSDTPSRLFDGRLQNILMIVGFALVGFVLIAAVWFRRGRTPAHCGPTMSPDLNQTGDEVDHEVANLPDPSRNPDKDKMVASIVVDLRVNSYSRDVLPGQRASETDVSLTETEGSAPITLGDADEDPNLDALEPGNLEQREAVRRRRKRNS